MKKTYQSPATRLVTVKVTHLMDPSPIGMTFNQASTNGSGEYNTLSRRGSSWNDDDE